MLFLRGALVIYFQLGELITELPNLFLSILQSYFVSTEKLDSFPLLLKYRNFLCQQCL